MENLLRDIRYACIQLYRRPGFTAVALLTLLLGIGINGAIFSIVNSVLLRPLPYEDPDRLVMLWLQDKGRDQIRGKFSQPELVDFQDRDIFQALAAVDDQTATFTGNGDPQQLPIGMASVSFWSILDVKARHGRVFLPGEDQPGGEQVAILSDGFWQRQFGGDPEILGETLLLDGASFTVVGVLPPTFRFFDQADLWIPLTIDRAELRDRGDHYLFVVGRLRDDRTLQQTQAEVDAMAAHMQELNPDLYRADSGFRVAAVPMLDDKVREIRPTLLILFGAGGFVLLITCANVANLLLARTQQRHKELAIRTSLGADRWRLLRQLLTEGLVLALVGGALGLALATGGLQALLGLAPAGVPRLDEVRLDFTVVGFVLAISVVTGLLASFFPAFRVSGTNLQETLKEGSERTGATAGAHRFRNLLAVAEIALALVVLIGAGLLVKNFRHLKSIDPGFRTAKTVTMQMTLPYSKYNEDHHYVNFFDELVSRVEALPEVESAGVVSHLPMSGSRHSGGFSIEGRPVEPNQGSEEAARRAVSPGYLETLGIELVEGRYFTTLDHAEAAEVVIIDETLAKRYFPDQSPLGRRLKRGSADGDRPWLTIVGVVRHVKHEGVAADSQVQIYFPHSQYPRWSMFLAARTRSGDPMSLVPQIRQQVLEIDPDQPVTLVRTMEDWLIESFSATRFSMLLLTSFAAIALGLATIGVYGILAASTAERIPEMGIRIAFGAHRQDVLWLVLLRGLRLAAAGIVVGLIAALFLTPLLATQLLEVRSNDPVTYVAMSLFLVLVALAASYVPARRATRVDPISVLHPQ